MKMLSHMYEWGMKFKLNTLFVPQKDDPYHLIVRIGVKNITTRIK